MNIEMVPRSFREHRRGPAFDRRREAAGSNERNPDGGNTFLIEKKKVETERRARIDEKRSRQCGRAVLLLKIGVSGRSLAPHKKAR